MGEIMYKPKEITKQCIYCGKDYKDREERTGPARMYCNSKCKVNMHNARKRLQDAL